MRGDVTSEAVAASFAREPYSPEILSEMIPLMVGHFKEIAKFKHLQLEPSVSHYAALSAAEVLRIFTARLDGRLIGYSVFVVMPHPHFRGSVQANEELLYLDPAERLGTLGQQFIAFSDGQLKQEGVQIVHRTVSQARDFSPILTRAGYELVDRVYARRIG